MSSTADFYADTPEHDSPEVVQEALKDLEIPDHAPPPGFLIEGIMCQAMVDTNTSMQALAEWTPGEEITQLQSAQAVCKSVAMSIREVWDVWEHQNHNPKKADSRHRNFYKQTKVLAKSLLELDPTAVDIESQNDPRITGSIKLICKFLEYGNIVLDVKASSKERRAAMANYQRWF